MRNDRPGGRGPDIAGDGEESPRLVPLEVPDAAARSRQCATDDRMRPRARWAQLGIRIQPLDQVTRPRLHLACGKIAHFIEVDTDIRIIGGEHEPDAIDSRHFGVTDRLLERRPRPWISARCLLAVGLVGNFGGLPLTDFRSPRNPLRACAELSGDGVRVGGGRHLTRSNSRSTAALMRCIFAVLS